VGGWILDVYNAVCDQVKSKPKYCPALSTGAIVGIVIACVVVVEVVVGVLVYFLVIKPKKAAVAPDQQAPTSGPAKTF
jgi:flagellar basal body-associated protein FliL